MGNMKELTKGLIAVELAKLATLYNYNGFTEKDTDGDLTDDAKNRRDTYLQDLGHLEVGQVGVAFKRIRQGWKPSGPNPFPAISDILSAVGKAPNDGVYMAIVAARGATEHVTYWDSVSFCDPVLHWVIDNFAGGWQALCEWTQDDWNYNMGKLIEAYRNAKISGKDGGNHLSGYAERQNGGGYVHWIDVHNRSSRGEIKFKGKITAGDMAKLNELCYGVPETASITDKHDDVLLLGHI